MEPDRARVFDSISYRVEFRATPGRDADGNLQFGVVMWSADLIIDEGYSLTAAGQTPAEAADKLASLVSERSQPLPAEGVLA